MRKLSPAQKTKNTVSKRTCALLYATWLLLFPGLALADVTDALNNFLSYLTGDLGKTVSAIAIVGFGYACFKLHKVEKSTFLYLVVGIGIIFGAQQILTMITG